MSTFSDFLVFVDESGDHGMDSIDPEYPVFVLAFCIVRKSDYIDRIVPIVQRFKFAHFGHDNVVLHEREIRKDVGPFSFLKSRESKNAFISELSAIIADAPMTIICSVIRKDLLRARYAVPNNPYHVALGFGLERTHYFLQGQDVGTATTHVMVECRGKREDADLELEFRRVCDGANYKQERLPLQIQFVDKRANLPGLQLADLIARPVGIHELRPQQLNRAYEIIEPKFYRSQAGKVRGWGLKCFP